MINSDDSAAIGATAAGFIVWLARQNAPHEQREYSPANVEQFLRWRCDQQANGSADDEDSYAAQLEQQGVPEVRVAEARSAIALLRQYLRSAGEG
ncbi:hypothetical protein ACTXG6_19295 [Pseudonocardia sp. Cha107L01]|uniref:hypothetical protein n=1 Tax=Pseudonocardia sp. Cha107L01 TaxID=3457576 RepID=UPI00403E61A3